MTNLKLGKLRRQIERLPVKDTPDNWMEQEERRPPGYDEATRDGIPAAQRKQIKAACVAGQWPLVLRGSHGTGKTCSAAVLFGMFQKQPLWYRADDLLMEISQARAGNASVRVQAISDYGESRTVAVPYDRFSLRVQTCSALFLDDLGIRKPSEAVYQTLFDLLEWRKGKPLIITTNKAISELAKMYDDRIVDRLTAGTVVKFEGCSRRQNKKP